MSCCGEGPTRGNDISHSGWEDVNSGVGVISHFPNVPWLLSSPATMPTEDYALLSRQIKPHSSVSMCLELLSLSESVCFAVPLFPVWPSISQTSSHGTWQFATYMGVPGGERMDACSSLKSRGSWAMVRIGIKKQLFNW